MSKISGGKVAAGGILAGVIMSGLDFYANNYALAPDWQDVARLHNLDLAVMGGTAGVVTMLLVDFALGQLLVLTYAAIRPRFGAGPGTAAIAAFLIFLSQALVLGTFGGVFLSWDLYVRQSAVTLVGMLAGAVAGAWVYAEEGEEEQAED
jgi:hypothetical protein